MRMQSNYVLTLDYHREGKGEVHSIDVIKYQKEQGSVLYSL